MRSNAVLVLALVVVCCADDGSRQTITGQSISNRICAMDSNGSCHWLDYLIWTVGQIGPYAFFMICALFTLLLGCPIFCCARHCCGCCGGSEPRPGFCCTSADADKKIYHYRTSVVVKVLIVFFFLGTGACFALAYVGNTQLSSGITGAFTHLLDSATTIVNRAAAVATKLAAIPYTNNQATRNAAAAAQSAATSFSNTVNSFQTDFNTYNGYRNTAITVAISVPLGFLGIAMILGLLNVRRFQVHLIISAFILLCLIAIWALALAHGLVYILFGDACTEANRVLDGQSTTSVFNSLLSCDASSFQQILDSANEGLNSARADACGAAQNFCSQASPPRLLTCPTSSTTCVASDTLSLQWAGSSNTGGVPRTISDCVNSCTSGSTEKSTSTAISDDFTFVDSYQSLLNNEIASLLNCTFLVTTIRTLQTDLCVTFIGGVKQVYICTAAMGSSLTVGILVLVFGQKRFLAKKDTRSKNFSPDDYEADERDYNGAMQLQTMPIQPAQPYGYQPAGQPYAAPMSPASPAPTPQANPYDNRYPTLRGGADPWADPYSTLNYRNPPPGGYAAAIAAQGPNPTAPPPDAPPAAAPAAPPSAPPPAFESLYPAINDPSAPPPSMPNDVAGFSNVLVEHGSRE